LLMWMLVPTRAFLGFSENLVINEYDLLYKLMKNDAVREISKSHPEDMIEFCRKRVEEFKEGVIMFDFLHKNSSRSVSEIFVSHAFQCVVPIHPFISLITSRSPLTITPHVMPWYQG